MKISSFVELYSINTMKQTVFSNNSFEGYLKLGFIKYLLVVFTVSIFFAQMLGYFLDDQVNIFVFNSHINQIQMLDK